MKNVFSFIMAFLVLSFSLIPCADGAAIKGEPQYSLDSSSSNDEHHDDACSPFCICTCCAGFSITSVTATTSPSVVPYILSHSSFVIVLTPTIALPVWQPPHLG